MASSRVDSVSGSASLARKIEKKLEALEEKVAEAIAAGASSVIRSTEVTPEGSAADIVTDIWPTWGLRSTWTRKARLLWIAGVDGTVSPSYAVQ